MTTGTGKSEILARKGAMKGFCNRGLYGAGLGNGVVWNIRNSPGGICRIFNKDFRIGNPILIQEIHMLTFTAVLHKEDDTYVAECPEVGTVSQGNTVEEAVNNLKEATELYLEEFPKTKKKRAILTTFEVSSIATS